MSKHKQSRKPMPLPSRPFKDVLGGVQEQLANQDIKDAYADWHTDPADSGWDWDAPSERDQRMWKITE
jgi:hypothetical protein